MFRPFLSMMPALMLIVPACGDDDTTQTTDADTTAGSADSGATTTTTTTGTTTSTGSSSTTTSGTTSGTTTDGGSSGTGGSGTGTGGGGPLACLDIMEQAACEMDPDCAWVNQGGGQCVPQDPDAACMTLDQAMCRLVPICQYDEGNMVCEGA